MRGISRGLRYLLASLATMLMVAALILVVALRQGPVPIGFAEPLLLHFLNERAGGLRIAFTGPALRWSRESRSLELEVRDLDLAAPGRPPLLSASHAAIDVVIEPLLTERRLVIDRMVLIEPGFELVRSEEGDFGLLLGGREIAAGDDPRDGRRRGLARLLAALFGGSKELRAAVEIRSFQVEEASLTILDRASGARLAGHGGARLSREEGRLVVDLSLEQGGLPAQLALAVRRLGPERFELKLDARRLRPAVLAAITSRPELAELDLRLDGSFTTGLDEEGRLSPGRFTLSAGPQSVGFPALWPGPLEIEAAEVAGTADAAARRVVMERISLRAHGAAAEGEGALLLGEAGPEVRVEATVRDLPARQLVAFWPVEVAAKAREWLDENLHDGMIEEGRLAVRDRPGEKADVEGDFRFKDAIVSFLPGMPAVEEGRGAGTFRREEVSITGTGGRLGPIAVERLDLTLADLTGDGRKMVLAVAGSGPVSGLMSLGTKLPEGIDVRLPVPPERVAGQGHYRLELERPLEKDVPPEQLVWRFSGELSGLEVRGIEDEIDIARGEAAFAADRDAVRVHGTARMNGVPVEVVEWRVQLQDSSRLRRAGTLRARPAVEDLARLGLPVPAGLSGAVGVELEVSEPRRGPRTTRIDLDLTPLEIDLPRFGLAKPDGRPGRLRAMATGPSDGTVLVEDVDLSLPDAEAQGALRLDVERGRLLQLDLRRLALAGSTGALAVRPQDGGGYQISLDADRLDLGALLKRSRGATERGGRSASGGAEEKLPPLDVALSARELRFHGGVMHALEGRITRTARGWHEGAMNATLTSGDRVSATLTPAAGGPELKISTRDAGGLLSFLDRNATYAPGGSFNLEGKIRAEQPRLRVAGKVAVRDYTLRQAPVLAQLLSLASLTGILNTLQGNGIHFDRARVDYELEGDRLKLADGRASGSELGFTFAGTIDAGEERVDIEGTVVPAYTLNRILGKVPIIGRLLRGEDGVGAFAATYSVKGGFDSPEVFVNPLSLIVPGFIRDLFGVPEPGAGEPAPEAGSLFDPN
ncbi:AsmA-like C-terminal domain-containing protein [Geminicoccaceae bacterium 1502E]|nr:AsmA-like C-terminal domain-containing protein [Geminicoccaceae bacterium 1502E]